MQKKRFLATLTIVMLLGALLPGIGASNVLAQDDPGPAPVIVTFSTADGSTFRTELAQPDDIAAAVEALEGDGYAGIPIGTLEYGDGGVNAPHEWHMVDTTLEEMTIELCDGTATMVDEDLEYWVDTVGQFCPWNATVVDVEPGVAPDPDEIVALIIAIIEDILSGIIGA